MNTENPVIELCVRGIEAEAEGRPDKARTLFLQAWALRQDDFDACIAAHYVARHQVTPRDELHWNLIAVTCADAVGDERVRAFYPSLYLNLGRSYGNVGDIAEAKRYYELAEQEVKALPDSPYKNMVQFGIRTGLTHLSEEVP